MAVTAVQIYLSSISTDRKRFNNVVREGKKHLRNIPYFHYSRKPLKEVYEKEYEVIKKKHEKEFINWLDNWKKYIREKYGNGDNK